VQEAAELRRIEPGPALLSKHDPTKTTEATSHAFPAARLRAALRRSLASRDGEAGISALLRRIESLWPQLHAEWTNRNSPGGARALGSVLLRTARFGDDDDLVGTDIRLRAMSSEGHADANVSSKIGRALLETLADGDLEAMVDLIKAMAAPDDVAANQFVNLVAIPLFMETGRFDEAITAAKWNRSSGFCPTSEYFLFESVAAKSASGLAVASGDVSIESVADRFCSQPFDTLSTANTRGANSSISFFACRCSATLPYPVSYAEDQANIDLLWNGADIAEIRRSILDGDFTYCSRTMCPYIAQGTLPKRNEIEDPFLRDIIDNHRTEIDAKPSWVMLGHDQSCNIACPSCRNDIISIKNEEREKLDAFSKNVLLPLLADSSAYVLVSADGDPFASKHYRRLIHNLDANHHAGVQLALLTNGLLFTPREWDALGHVQKLVARVSVSIDGARSETYEKLRWPGKWDKITANMEFLKQLRQQGKVPSLFLHFVVQEENFEEMVAFVELARQWNADGVIFIRMLNMGSFSTESFQAKDVSDPRHPLHTQFLEILRHPVLRDPYVNLLSLAPLQQGSEDDRVPSVESLDLENHSAALGLHESIVQRIRRWIPKRVSHILSKVRT
jgi:pyruvate-formate lyase-activating enzyme